MGGVLQLDWSGVLKLLECLLDISLHGDIQYSGLVVTVQCDATVNIPCSILYYCIFFLECIYEVLGVFSSMVSDYKVVDH